MAQKIVIPKGTINPAQTTVIEIPNHLHNSSVVVAQNKSPESSLDETFYDRSAYAGYAAGSSRSSGGETSGEQIYGIPNLVDTSGEYSSGYEERTSLPRFQIPKKRYLDTSQEFSTSMESAASSCSPCPMSSFGQSSGSSAGRSPATSFDRSQAPKQRLDFSGSDKSQDGGVPPPSSFLPSPSYGSERPVPCGAGPSRRSPPAWGTPKMPGSKNIERLDRLRQEREPDETLDYDQIFGKLPPRGASVEESFHESDLDDKMKSWLETSLQKECKRRYKEGWQKFKPDAHSTPASYQPTAESCQEFKASPLKYTPTKPVPTYMAPTPPDEDPWMPEKHGYPETTAREAKFSYAAVAKHMRFCDQIDFVEQEAFMDDIRQYQRSRRRLIFDVANMAMNGNDFSDFD